MAHSFSPVRSDYDDFHINWMECELCGVRVSSGDMVGLCSSPQYGSPHAKRDQSKFVMKALEAAINNGLLLVYICVNASLNFTLVFFHSSIR
jgi:predicted NAD/FAD-dependent oxidoreductase